MHLQIRSLEELEWESELKDLLIQNKDYIDNSHNIMLKKKLAWAMNDRELFAKLSAEEARNTFDYGDMVFIKYGTDTAKEDT